MLVLSAKRYREEGAAVGALTRVLLVSLVTLVLAIAGLLSFAVVTVRTSFPQTSGVIQVTPLNRAVEVLRDERGVPQIYADSPEDLFTAQGFVQAQDRFWEMDVRRHLAAGRLSELLGESAVPTDVFVRTLGVRRVAEQEVKLLSARHRRYLEAYADGVNAYLRGRSANELSLEYAVLGLQGLSYVPEEWTAVDSLAWLKMMAWELGSDASAEIELAALSATIGEQRARFLQPHFDPEVFHPIVTTGSFAAQDVDPIEQAANGTAAWVATTPEAVAALRDVAVARNLVADRLGGDGAFGSNSWVVSGERTESGRPLLANAPHLPVGIPSVFAQVGLHCRTVTSDCPFDVSGFSLAGMPGVLIGHNAHIAWGISNSGVDTQDLVIEQIRGTQVRREGDQWDEVTERVEVIGVADGEDRAVRVRETSNGPILSDVLEALPQEVTDGVEVPTADTANPDVDTVAALQWTALVPSRSIEAIFEVNRATDFTTFREAVGQLVTPSLNFVFADINGNIGYQLSGDIPVRRQGDGTMPVPGWDPAYGWDRMIAPDQLPYAYNPPEGFIVAANQQIIADYPLPLGSQQSKGWRSQQIIHELNAQQTPLTVTSTQAIFADSTVRYAELILPSLLAIEPSEEWVRDGQEVLRTWDRTSEPDSAGAFYFHLVMRHIVHLTFDDEIPEDLRSGSGDRWYGVVAELLRQPHNEWWDDKSTSVIENRNMILDRALSHARRDATVLRSVDPANWSWGHRHRLRLRHATLGRSGQEPVENLFNRGNEPVGGGNDIVLAWSFDDRAWGFDVTAGPVAKMVVDLADLDNSRWINLSGQSGHAYHPNYADQLPLIARNELLPWAFTRSRVEEAVTQRLELLPGR